MARRLPVVLAAVAVVALIGVAVTFAIVATGDDAADSKTLVVAPGLGMMSSDAFGGMMGTPPTSRGDIAPVGSMSEASASVEEWLDGAGFEGFAVGEVMAFSNGYYVAVEDAGGRGAFELLLDAATGWISPEPGPNMMWNTDYGMMGGRLGGFMMGGGMMGGLPGSQLAEPLSAEQAQRLADDWLDQVLPGETVGEPLAFPGYYTFDTERDGRVQGMLSVNAQTSAVWYHVWHGSFLDELET